eukprot:148003_1
MAVLEAIHDSVLCFWLRKNVSELEKYVLMILDACTDTIAPVVAHLKAAGSEKASQCSVDLRGSVALRLLPGLILVTAATMHTDPESAATEIGSNFPPPPPSDRPLSLRLSDLQQSATSEALRVFFKERADVDGKRVRTVVVDGVGGGWVSFSEEAALQSVMDCEKSIDGHPFSAEPYDFYRTGLSGFSISDEVATKLGLILRHLDFICKQTPSILQSEKTFIEQTVDASQFIQNTLIVQTIHPVHSNYLTSNITVSIPGVSCLKLNFSPKCRTSRNNDSLKLYRGPGMINHVDGTDYSGDMGGPVGFPVDTVKIDGDSVVFSHTQDSGCEYWGYKCTVTGHFPTIIPELPLILDVLKTISWTLGLYASRLISHESSVAVDDVSLEKLLDSKLFSGGISLEGRESDIRTDSPKTMERRDSEQKLLSSIAEGTGPGKRILELLNPNSGKNIFKRLNRMQFAGRLYADEVHSCERLFIATLIKHCRLVDVCQRVSSRNDSILPSSLSKIVTILQRYQRWILLQHQILGKEGPSSTESHSLQSTDVNGTRSFPSFVRSLYDKLTFVMQTRAAAEVMVFSLDVPVLHRLFSMEMKTSAPPICIGVTDPRSRWRKVLCIVKPAVKLMLILKTTRLVRFQLFQSSRTFASEDAAIELLSFVQSPNLTRARIFHFLRRRARVVDKRARGYRLRAGVLRTASLASVKCQVLEAESEGGTGKRCHYLTGMGTTDDVLTSRVMFAFESFFKAVFDGLTDFGKEVNELVCNDPGSIDLAFVLLKSLELEFKKSDLHIFTRMQVFPKMFEMLIAVNAAVSSYKDVPESPDSSYTAAKLSKLMIAIWSTVNRILRICLGLCSPETGSGGPEYETEIPLSARPPLSKDHAQLVKNIVRSAVFQLGNVRDLNIRVVLHELIYDISCFHIVTPYLAKPNTLEKLLKALDFSTYQQPNRRNASGERMFLWNALANILPSVGPKSVTDNFEQILLLAAKSVNGVYVLQKLMVISSWSEPLVQFICSEIMKLSSVTNSPEVISSNDIRDYADGLTLALNLLGGSLSSKHALEDGRKVKILRKGQISGAFFKLQEEELSRVVKIGVCADSESKVFSEIKEEVPLEIVEVDDPPPPPVDIPKKHIEILAKFVFLQIDERGSIETDMRWRALQVMALKSLGWMMSAEVNREKISPDTVKTLLHWSSKTLESNIKPVSTMENRLEDIRRCSLDLADHTRIAVKFVATPPIVTSEMCLAKLGGKDPSGDEKNKCSLLDRHMSSQSVMRSNVTFNEFRAVLTELLRKESPTTLAHQVECMDNFELMDTDRCGRIPVYSALHALCRDIEQDGAAPSQPDPKPQWALQLTA